MDEKVDRKLTSVKKLLDVFCEAFNIENLSYNVCLDSAGGDAKILVVRNPPGNTELPEKGALILKEQGCIFASKMEDDGQYFVFKLSGNTRNKENKEKANPSSTPKKKK